MLNNKSDPPLPHLFSFCTPPSQFKASDLADLGGFGGAATTTDDDDDIDEKPPTYMLFSLCCYVVNPVFGMLAIICSILSGNYFDEGKRDSVKMPIWK